MYLSAAPLVLLSRLDAVGDMRHSLKARSEAFSSSPFAARLLIPV